MSPCYDSADSTFFTPQNTYIPRPQRCSADWYACGRVRSTSVQPAFPGQRAYPMTWLTLVAPRISGDFVNDGKEAVRRDKANCKWRNVFVHCHIPFQILPCRRLWSLAHWLWIYSLGWSSVSVFSTFVFFRLPQKIKGRPRRSDNIVCVCLSV